MATTGATGAAAAESHLWIKSYPKDVDWHMPLAPAPLYKLLDGAAASFPSRTCTNFLGKTLTYAEISALVDKAAAGLQKIGVMRGTKVGLFTEQPDVHHLLLRCAQSGRRGRQL